LRPETVPAANAALCAADQGKYLEFSNALYSQPAESTLTRVGFVAAAEEVGLDSESFISCVENGRYNNTISANQQAAQANRVSGTPTFFINDQIVSGNVPLEEFERIFNQHIGS
jgi:protein-disulfide isomerase